MTATTSAAAPSSISLAGRAGHTFDPPTMLQGFVCHARGVELSEATPSRVVARVRSKRLHDVRLVARGGRLVIACSCPARSFGRVVCKHAWAALLEIDRSGGLEDLGAVRGLLPVEAAPLDDGGARGKPVVPPPSRAGVDAAPQRPPQRPPRSSRGSRPSAPTGGSKAKGPPSKEREPRRSKARAKRRS